MKQWTSLLRETVARFLKDCCPRMAAALAYYTMFSLAPLLLVSMWIGGLFFETQRVQGQLNQELANFLGPRAASQIQQMIEHAGERDQQQWVGRLASVGVLLFGASGLMLQLQIALNEIWRVAPNPQRNAIKRLVVKRIFSFGMIVVVGALLLASIVLNMWLQAVRQMADDYFGGELLQAVFVHGSAVISLAVTMVLLLIIFKYLPDAEISWRQVLLGAALTALMLALGRWGVGMYLGSKNLGSLYGAAGSLVLVLTWIYYSTMILLLGAEFTYVWAHRNGEVVRPEHGAIRVERVEVH